MVSESSGIQQPWMWNLMDFQDTEGTQTTHLPETFHFLCAKAQKHSGTCPSGSKYTLSLELLPAHKGSYPLFPLCAATYQHWSGGRRHIQVAVEELQNS